MKETFKIFEYIKANNEIDIEGVLSKRNKFNSKKEDLNLKTLNAYEVYQSFQEIDQIYNDVFVTLDKLVNLASEFYHQKYFNKFLLG